MGQSTSCQYWSVNPQQPLVVQLIPFTAPAIWSVFMRGCHTQWGKQGLFLQLNCACGLRGNPATAPSVWADFLL